VKPWGLFFGLLSIASIFVAIEFLYHSRASAMRSLAARLNFQYSAGDPRKWTAGRVAATCHPAGFHMACYPTNKISRMWNVLDGQRNGIRVVIFDSTVGEGKGLYCSVGAVQASENQFEIAREKIALCSGWCAVYRTRFFQAPWTLSVSRIEELAKSL
jgi:hypothetical protein